MKSEKHRELIDNHLPLTNYQLPIINYQLICLLFLPFCLLASLAAAEISSEQLDPADFLMLHLTKPSKNVSTPKVTSKTSQDLNTNVTPKTSQDVNTPNVPESPNAPLYAREHSILLENLPSARQEQSQTPDIAPVKAAHQPTRHSEQRKPSAPSIVDGVEGQESLLTTQPASQSLPRAYRADDSKKRCQLPQDTSAITENPISRAQRQLWRARITAPKDQKNKRSKNELQQIIEQIRTVKFEPANRSPEPFIVVEPLPTIKPNQTLEGPHLTDSKTQKSTLEAPAISHKTRTFSDTELTEKPKAKEIKSKPQTPHGRQPDKLQNEKTLSYVPVTSQTLQMLENLLQHPDQMDNPFELAEVLFLSGHLKEASVFYWEALNRNRPDQSDTTKNRPWILFQIGNCLRHDDTLTAMKMYRQLISEYPDSPWTDLAKARHKLINWYQKDKPRTLIANPISQ